MLSCTQIWVPLKITFNMIAGRTRRSAGSAVRRSWRTAWWAGTGRSTSTRGATTGTARGPRTERIRLDCMGLSPIMGKGILLTFWETLYGNEACTQRNGSRNLCLFFNSAWERRIDSRATERGKHLSGNFLPGSRYRTTTSGWMVWKLPSNYVWVTRLVGLHRSASWHRWFHLGIQLRLPQVRFCDKLTATWNQYLRGRGTEFTDCCASSVWTPETPSARRIFQYKTSSPTRLTKVCKWQSVLACRKLIIVIIATWNDSSPLLPCKAVMSSF